MRFLNESDSLHGSITDRVILKQVEDCINNLRRIGYEKQLESVDYDLILE